ncbi:MAG: branched-chain amino acid ABC transporter substrate-binding protein [Hyphomicrobium sp.]|nr:branched-chain amino acid ABC transporter substrate-binding protein [Hyphomicrobium sp.]
MRKLRSVRSISTQAGLRAGRGIALAMALCSSGAAASEIVITVAGPVSGPHSGRTAQMLAGARLAADAVNAHGGIKGATLRIASADDGCAAETAKSAATALVARKTDLVIGHPCAAAADAAANIYATAETLFIATGTRHSALQSGPQASTIFRLSGRDNQQGVEAANFLADHFGGQAIAIVHDRTQASKKLSDVAEETLKKRGASAPIISTVIGGDKDFPILTGKIKSVAAVFYAGYPLEAGMLFTQLRRAGSTAAFLMSESGGTTEFTETFGAGAEGLLVMRPRFALQPAKGAAENGDSAPSPDAQITDADHALAAAAVAVYASAANAADAVNPGRVAHELASRTHATAHGTVAFDTNGNAVRPSYDIFKWTGKLWDGPNTALSDR